MVELIKSKKELKEQQKAMPLEDEAEEDSEINDQAEDDGDVKQDLKNTQKIHNVVPELFSSFKGAQKETKKDEISRIASASSNANINDNVTTDDKADRKLSRFN